MVSGLIILSITGAPVAVPVPNVLASCDGIVGFSGVEGVSIIPVEAQPLRSDTKEAINSKCLYCMRFII